MSVNSAVVKWELNYFEKEMYDNTECKEYIIE